MFQVSSFVLHISQISELSGTGQRGASFSFLGGGYSSISPILCLGDFRQMAGVHFASVPLLVKQR